MAEELTESAYRSRPVAVGGWVLAGVPIIVTGVQAVAELSDTVVENWPVLGPISGGVKEIPVFQEMATAFKPSAPILGLFVLIAISWFVLGLSLFRPAKVLRDYAREVRGWSVGATTVLYGVLFLWSYWELFTSTPALSELVVLAGLPVVVFVGIGLAYSTQPRTNGNRLLNIIEGLLNDLEDEVETVDDRLETQLAKLDTDIKTDIDAVDTVPEVEERKQKIRSLRDEAEETRSLPENKRERAAVQLIEDEIEPLQSTDIVPKAEHSVRAELGDWLCDRFGSTGVEFTSDTFGEPYSITNKDEYRSIAIDVRFSEFSVNNISVSEIDELADTIVEESVPVGQTVTIVNTVVEHFASVRRDLKDREEEFTKVTGDVQAGLERAADQIERTPGRVGVRLREIYQLGAIEDEGVSHMGIIDSDYGTGDEPGELNRATENHHECRFSTAIELAENARTRVDQLNEVLTFIRKITRTVEEGVESVTVPEFTQQTNPFFTRELIEQEVNARLSGVRLDPEWEVGRVVYRYQDGQGEAAGVEEESDDGGPPDHIILDGVRWLLNALEEERIGTVHVAQESETNGGSSEVTVEIDRDELPRTKNDPAVVQRAADHITAQSGLNASVDEKRVPEKLAFTVADSNNTKLNQQKIGAALVDSFTRASRY